VDSESEDEDADDDIEGDEDQDGEEYEVDEDKGQESEVDEHADYEEYVTHQDITLADIRVAVGYLKYGNMWNPLLMPRPEPEIGNLLPTVGAMEISTYIMLFLHGRLHLVLNTSGMELLA